MILSKTTNIFDLTLTLSVFFYYIFKLRYKKFIFSKYRLILFFEGILCFFIQFTKYDSGDLFFYSKTFFPNFARIYYFLTYKFSGGYLFGSIITILLLIELRLKMLNYLLLLDKRLNENKIISKFRKRIFIYLFVFSPSFNIFLFFQGKDIICAIIISFISIALLENYLNIDYQKRLVKKFNSFVLFLSYASLFNIRFYYIIVYFIGHFNMAFYSITQNLKIKFKRLKYKDLLFALIFLIAISTLIYYVKDIYYRIEMFYNYLTLSEAKKQFYTGFQDASIQLQPWDWPWKIFNVLRPLPWNLDQFNNFQRVFIVDHYFAIIAIMIIFTKPFKNKLFFTILLFLLITMCTVLTSNVNDMYRRLPVYFLLPMPILINSIIKLPNSFNSEKI